MGLVVPFPVAIRAIPTSTSGTVQSRALLTPIGKAVVVYDLDVVPDPRAQSSNRTVQVASLPEDKGESGMNFEDGSGTRLRRILFTYILFLYGNQSNTTDPSRLWVRTALMIPEGRVPDTTQVTGGDFLSTGFFDSSSSTGSMSSTRPLQGSRIRSTLGVRSRTTQSSEMRQSNRSRRRNGTGSSA